MDHAVKRRQMESSVAPERTKEDSAMRASRAFVLGTIMGAAVVWLWGREIGEYVERKARRVRSKAAKSVRAVEEKAGKVLDRGGDALSRAHEFLRDTREDVSEAFRAGQEAMRSTPAARKE